MCDQTQNFSLSIKLVDKNHIIYNKKATNTQNLFKLMKERQRGEKNNIANNCKVRSRNNETSKNCLYIVEILSCEKDDINKKKEFR